MIAPLVYILSAVALASLTVEAGKSKKPDPGDLIKVESTGLQVGVLLSELPEGDRDRLASYVLAKDDDWWETRARQQLALTTYKLQFQTSFYPNRQQMMLPADDDAITITFTSDAHRAVHNHQKLHFIVRDYVIYTYIVGLAGSSHWAAPDLGKIGVPVHVPYSLPLDPVLLIQRTGYACQDEDQFPRYSLDAEAAPVYYDDTCVAGNVVEGVAQQCLYAVTGCHCTVNVSIDCVDALEEFSGRVKAQLTFTHVPWDERQAEHYEALSSYQLRPGATGADLREYEPGIEHNWIIYKYFDPTSCAVNECLSDSGWRKLLLFDSIDVNVGSKEIVLGNIPYKSYNASSFNETNYHHMYYWGVCHGHPHFAEYAMYNWGDNFGHKQGFCIQSTNRIVNTRNVSIVSPYQNCSLQGITVGWADDYNGGIPCQWVDITAESTSAGPVTQNLTIHGNPAEWLCEGTVLRDQTGAPLWMFSGNYTVTPPWPIPGLPIDIYKCITSPNAYDNNVGSTLVTDPRPGQALLTSTCPVPDQIFGPKRDCEMSAGSMMNACTPGAKVTQHCSIPKGAKAQILRICESSINLNTGTACRYNDDSILANVIITPGAATKVTFTCPVARDPIEVGGFFSVYSGPAFNNVDAVATVTCA